MAAVIEIGPNLHSEFNVCDYRSLIKFKLTLVPNQMNPMQGGMNPGHSMPQRMNDPMVMNAPGGMNSGMMNYSQMNRPMGPRQGFQF